MLGVQKEEGLKKAERNKVKETWAKHCSIAQTSPVSTEHATAVEDVHVSRSVGGETPSQRQAFTEYLAALWPSPLRAC